MEGELWAVRLLCGQSKKKQEAVETYIETFIIEA